MKLRDAEIGKKTSPYITTNIKEVNFVDALGNVILKLNNIKSASMTVNNGYFNERFINATIDADNMMVIQPIESKDKYIDMMENKVYKEI